MCIVVSILDEIFFFLFFFKLKLWRGGEKKNNQPESGEQEFGEGEKLWKEVFLP